MKKLLTLLLALILSTTGWKMDVKAAPDWPGDTGILADGGIVMDANTGTVLYGQNIHVQYFPASITKILTALLVLEHANMDEMVTFSYNAVFNVEAGSSNAGLDVGDQLSVKDCLYAMMLRSANEAANALAEHVAGSVEEFAKMMNERAQKLGCTKSNFVNPNGLNNPDHKTSAYDMALIASEAFKNPEFVKIASTTYYKLPPTLRNPEGLAMSPGHKMLSENNPQYYPGIIGGKTGYTSLAGNTLVTCVEKDGVQLVAVILNGAKTHYEDTKALMDFGFSNFKNLKISDNETRYEDFEKEIVAAGIDLSQKEDLAWDSSGSITLPKDAQFSDAVATLTYEMTAQDSVDTVAKIQYTYGQRKIGSASLKPGGSGPKVTAVAAKPSGQDPSQPETSAPQPDSDGMDSKSRKAGSNLGAIVLIGLILVAMFAGGIGYKRYRDKKEEEERQLRRKRRLERLREAGVSESEFEELLSKRKPTHKK